MNGNTAWRDAIRLEIKQLNDYATFQIVPDGTPIPKGYRRIPHQVIFDVKFDRHLKAKLVAGRH